MPRPGIEPGTPESVIERHNHEAKRSGPVRLVIYVPYIFTNILIIYTSLCRATTLLHPIMKHLYQMFSTIPRLFCDSVAIASPLGSNGSHPGHGTKCSRRKNRPVKKIFPSSALTGDRTRSVIEHHNHEAKRSGPVRLVIYAPYIFTNILIICTSLCCATTLKKKKKSPLIWNYVRTQILILLEVEFSSW